MQADEKQLLAMGFPPTRVKAVLSKTHVGRGSSRGGGRKFESALELLLGSSTDSSDNSRSTGHGRGRGRANGSGSSVSTAQRGRGSKRSAEMHEQEVQDLTMPGQLAASSSVQATPKRARCTNEDEVLEVADSSEMSSEKVAASSSSGACNGQPNASWEANFKVLRTEMLHDFPKEDGEAVHSIVQAAVAKADKAVANGQWIEGFDVLMSARDKAEAKSVPMCVARATGEPLFVARSMLIRSGGDELATVSSAIALRDLVQEGLLSFNLAQETCSICTCDAEPRQAVRLPCKHGWYCLDCLARHTETQLGDGKAGLSCFECNAPLAERMLRALLPKRLLDKLLDRGFERAVGACKDVRPCPTPDCKNRVVLEEGAVPQLQCQLCGKDSCLLCGEQPYHTGRPCKPARSKQAAAPGSRTSDRNPNHKADEDDGSEGLTKWMEQTGTKQCPTCRMAISKTHLEAQKSQRMECHKMICRNCGARFCFSCLTPLTETSSCNCTKADHGFIDPRTGRFVPHVRRRR